ncbi:MAG: hypothetical protein RIT81_44705 [Deltaproteobacteria bacterium]
MTPIEIRAERARARHNRGRHLDHDGRPDETALLRLARQQVALTGLPPEAQREAVLTRARWLELESWWAADGCPVWRLGASKVERILATPLVNEHRIVLPSAAFAIACNPDCNLRVGGQRLDEVLVLQDEAARLLGGALLDGAPAFFGVPRSRRLDSLTSEVRTLVHLVLGLAQELATAA